MSNNSQHTSFTRDWSSDVLSSDLEDPLAADRRRLLRGAGQCLGAGAPAACGGKGLRRVAGQEECPGQHAPVHPPAEIGRASRRDRVLIHTEAILSLYIHYTYSIHV